MTSELQFIDELPEGESVGERRSATRAAAYKANPNRWAPWPAKTAMSGVKKVLAPYGPGFEIVGRKVDDKIVVFVRYVPPVAAVPNGTTQQTSKPQIGQVAGHVGKVACPTCHDFINVNSGETNGLALQRHERTNPICKAANRRNR